MPTVVCRDLGTMGYKTCWNLQQTLFDELVAHKTGTHLAAENTTADARSNTAADTGSSIAEAHTEGRSTEATAVDHHAGTILLVEHPPVYTLGKSGHTENLLVSSEALEQAGAQFFHIDRGGDITFHGPGQIVCYPILDLEAIGIGLRAYIEALEEAVICTVAHYGIEAGRIAGASGVWVVKTGCVPRKICAIGVRSSRYVTMHGFALNVSTDLGWFSRINPCGFTDRGVTSIEQQIGRKVDMDEVKGLVVRFLSGNLNVKIYK